MTNKLKYVLLVLTVIPIIGMIIWIFNPELFFFTQEITRDWLLWFWIIAPLVFIVLQVIQVIFPPISHYTVWIIGGFIYWPFLWGFLNWLGRIIWHSIAFFISKQFWRKYLEKFLSSSELNKLDTIISWKNNYSPQAMVLFLFYFLPLFPDDEISYVVWTSKMKYKTFILINALWHVWWSLGLAYIWSWINTKDPLFWFLFFSTFIWFILIWFHYRKLKK